MSIHRKMWVVLKIRAKWIDKNASPVDCDTCKIIYGHHLRMKFRSNKRMRKKKKTITYSPLFRLRFKCQSALQSYVESINHHCFQTHTHTTQKAFLNDSFTYGQAIKWFLFKCVRILITVDTSFRISSRINDFEVTSNDTTKQASKWDVRTYHFHSVRANKWWSLAVCVYLHLHLHLH